MSRMQSSIQTYSLEGNWIGTLVCADTAPLNLGSLPYLGRGFKLQKCLGIEHLHLPKVRVGVVQLIALGVFSKLERSQKSYT